MFKKIKKEFFLSVSLITLIVFFLVCLILNLTMKASIDHKYELRFEEIRSNGYTEEKPSPSHNKGEIPSRYILVTLENGSIKDIQGSEKFFVDPKKTEETVHKILAKNSSFGNTDFYYYSYQDDTMILMDARTDIESRKNTLFISSTICSVSFILISLAAFLTSSLIVRPYERLYRKERTFFTNASHELKTPLAIIQTNDEVLKETYGDNKWISSNFAQTKRMNQLIREMVSLGKIEELQGQVKMSDFDLSELLLDAIVPYQEAFQAKGIEWKEEINSGVRFYGNDEFIMKLFQTLTDNALKYTTSPGSFSVSLKEEKKTVTIVFSNSTDLPPETDLSNIFDRFYSLDKSKSKKSSGFGIGLSIAKAVVDVHKGKITATLLNGMIYFTIEFKKGKSS